MSSNNALVRSTPPSFVAKTYNITSLNRRVEIIHALANDPLYDRLNANLQLNGIPAFHGHSRDSKTNPINHRIAQNDIKKEHMIAVATHNELDHYKQIISRYMEDESFEYLKCIKMKVDTIHDLSLVIAHRLSDLFSIEKLLYINNPSRENLPEAFCDAVEAAKHFNSQARGGMLHYHAYLKNHELEDGGPHGGLREPPPLKRRKTFVQTVAKAPKALVRRITGL